MVADSLGDEPGGASSSTRPAAGFLRWPGGAIAGAGSRSRFAGRSETKASSATGAGDEAAGRPGCCAACAWAQAVAQVVHKAAGSAAARIKDTSLPPKHLKI